MKNIKVSVIIATLDRAGSLGRCLDSISRQTCRPHEVIVVDNGSKDNTAEVALSYKKMLPIVYLMEERRDVSIARNRGIEASTGEVVAFTDDDCAVGEGWIRNIIESHNSSGSKIIGGMLLNGYPGSLVCRLWQRIFVLWFNYVNVLTAPGRSRYEFPQGQCFVKTLTTNNVSYRREVFDRAGWFREDASMNEDAEFHYRLRESGERILYSSSISVSHYYRNNIGSMFRALYVSGKGLFRIKNKDKVYNSLLELTFRDKCRFAASLFYYPIYLLKEKEIMEAVSILPFFIFKEAAVLSGFISEGIDKILPASFCREGYRLR